MYKKKNYSRTKEQGITYVLKLISGRDYLSNTIVEKLKKKGYSQTIIAEIMEHIDQLGYIDDQQYVESFIKSGINKKLGRYKIKSKLMVKGVDSLTIDNAIQLLYKDEKEIENLKYWLEKKFNIEDLKKTARFCINKGFSPSITWDQINLIKNGENF